MIVPCSGVAFSLASVGKVRHCHRAGETLISGIDGDDASRKRILERARQGEKVFGLR